MGIRDNFDTIDWRLPPVPSSAPKVERPAPQARPQPTVRACLSHDLVMDAVRKVQCAAFAATARGFAPIGFGFSFDTGVVVEVELPDDALIASIPEHLLYTDGTRAWTPMHGVAVRWTLPYARERGRL